MEEVPNSPGVMYMCRESGPDGVNAWGRDFGGGECAGAVYGHLASNGRYLDEAGVD